MTRAFLDTDILLYSISTAREERAKRQRAIELLERDDVGLSVQVLQEFYVQATHARRPDALSHQIAAGLIRVWTRFRVQDTTLAVLNGAFEIKTAYGLSYWDSAIVAAARALGCRELYSEDMNHGQEFEGIVAINPFRH
jgi:predicted nucleic acid-binding protein